MLEITSQEDRVDVANNLLSHGAIELCFIFRLAVAKSDLHSSFVPPFHHQEVYIIRDRLRLVCLGRDTDFPSSLFVIPARNYYQYQMMYRIGGHALLFKSAVTEASYSLEELNI